MIKQPAVYILTNRKNGVLYTGVTSDLIKRIFTHKNGYCKGFSWKYNCKELVYYELFSTMEDAISREKKIKAGSRSTKVKLIESSNPDWKDLYETICS